MTINGWYERLQYLRTHQKPYAETFAENRWMNQSFYMSTEWRRVRRMVIARDFGWDLAVEGLDVVGKPCVHHINPIDENAILHSSDDLLDPENLILCSFDTHNLIHFGKKCMTSDIIVERSPFDTCPWRVPN